MFKNHTKFFKVLILISSFAAVLCVAFLSIANAADPSVTESAVEAATSSVTATITETAEATESGIDAEAIGEQVNSILNWLKSVNMDDVRGWLIALCAKLGIDTATLFAFLIYYVKSKAKEAKDSKFYQDLIAKLDAEHQQKVEEITGEFNEKLDVLANTLTDYIKKQNSEKRQEAQKNVDIMKDALSEVKVNLDE